MALTTRVKDVRDEFFVQRTTAEKAIAQLDDDQIRRSLDGDVNSVIIIMKHAGGNLRSRFTNFLTEDGEKPWRHRDGEFVDDFPPGRAGRDAAMKAWNEGWDVLTAALDSLTDADLPRIVRIRGEAMPASRALARALAHAAYHTGQMILIARILAGADKWETISIPRGGSEAFNRSQGFGIAQDRSFGWSGLWPRSTLFGAMHSASSTIPQCSPPSPTSSPTSSTAVWSFSPMMRIARTRAILSCPRSSSRPRRSRSCFRSRADTSVSR